MEQLRPGEGDEDRLERSRRVSWMNLASIQESKCLVVGAGALGNEVVKNLVLSGFRHITLVDMDRVVRSNLNRCLFFRREDADLRRMKAEVVAERSRDLDPELDIRPITTKIEALSEKEVASHDLVFGCLDNIAARLHVNSHAYYHHLPYIDGGTNGTSGRVQVVLPGDPCLQCGMNRSHFRVLERRFSCTDREVTFYEPHMAAEITTTSVIAAIQVREGIKIRSRREADCIQHVLHYDGLHGNSETYELEVNPQCPLHL